MKYIRLEEGVFQVGEKVIIEPNNNKNATSFPNESGYYITRKNKYDGIDFRYAGESEIIKESDNLEVLCDEFILVDDNSHTLERDLKELTKYKKYIGGSHGIVYGAIWTGKGLIYVARMNKDGKWELM